MNVGNGALQSMWRSVILYRHFLPVMLKMLTFAGKYETEYENIEIR